MSKLLNLLSSFGDEALWQTYEYDLRIMRLFVCSLQWKYEKGHLWAVESDEFY